MKRLNFEKHLAEMILNNEKTTTWRVDDEKDVSVGDKIECTYKDDQGNRHVFAVISVYDVWAKKFKDIDENDLAGYEKFPTVQSMYEWYSRVYKQEVQDNTTLKVIKFTVLEKYGL